MTTSSTSRLRKAIVIAACTAGALFAAGCASTAPPAAVTNTGTATGHLVAHKTTPAKTTATTLPQCGATRDPLDPTNTPPPAGSPAICPP